MPTPPAGQIGCGTTLVYRNLVLGNCELKEFSQVAQMDESNTDLMFHRFRVVIESHIHEESEAMGAIGVNTTNTGTGGYTAGNAIDVAQRIRQWLLRPRGNLELYFDGIPYINVLGPYNDAITTIENGSRHFDITNAALRSQFDVDNGPKPISCQVVHVAGHKAFKIRYVVEFSIVECDPDTSSKNSAGDPDYAVANMQARIEVLNNRWQVQETRDANFMMTRTTTGTLRVRSYQDMATRYRRLCVPSLPRGYKRQNMSFTQSKDGLTLSYIVTDVQRYAAPPKPAIEWRGRHTENVNRFGESGTTSIDLYLRGAVTTKKADLFSAAIATINHRIGGAKLLENGNAAGQSTLIPVNFSLVDVLHEPEIHVQVTLKRIPSAGIDKYANLIYEQLGKLPAVDANVVGNTDAARDDQVTNFYNKDSWPVPIAFDGSTPTGVFITYLQDPCIQYHGIPEQTAITPEGVDTGASTYEPGSTGIDVYEQEIVGLMPPAPDSVTDSQLNPEHRDFQYTHYEAESKYVTCQGLQALPYARVQQTTTDDQVAIVQVTQPITYHDYWIRGNRVGKTPSLPTAPDSRSDNNATPINEFKIHEEIVFKPPQIQANGQMYEYGIEGYFRYALSRKPNANEKIRVGSLPWDTTTPVTNEVVRTAIENPNLI